VKYTLFIRYSGCDMAYDRKLQKVVGRKACNTSFNGQTNCSLLTFVFKQKSALKIALSKTARLRKPGIAVNVCEETANGCSYNCESL